MSGNLDDAIASGDEQAIEAALAEAEFSDDVLFEDGDAEEAQPEQEVVEPEQQDENVEEVNDEKTSDKNDVVETPKKAVEAAPESSPAEEEKPSNVIEKDGKFFVEVSKDNAELDSKNGKHKLPFDLLAGTREENLALKKQLDEQAKTNAELKSGLDETKRVAELHSKQLAENGLDPKLLPEQMLKDPELMAQVKEDYPQIGELVEALASQLQKAQQPAPEVAQQTETPSDSGTNDVSAALEQTSHLKEWVSSDTDRWEMAKIIDTKLAEDPSFANKTISERFAEVEKRVMSAFGDEIEQEVEQKSSAPAAKTPEKQPEKTLVPNSPTDIGHQGSDLSATNQFMDKDAATMTQQMAGMSEAAIEAMLEEASDFL